jgi:hypothetical protein
MIPRDGLLAATSARSAPPDCPRLPPGLTVQAVNVYAHIVNTLAEAGCGLWGRGFKGWDAGIFALVDGLGLGSAA